MRMTLFALNNQSSKINILQYDKIQDIEDFEVVLDTLNQFGNERGYSFKKGTSKQNLLMRKNLYKDRNKEKHKPRR